MWRLDWFGNVLHNIPVNDSAVHWPDQYCLCVPEFQQEGPDGDIFICTHNAWDGREAAERQSAGAAWIDYYSHTLDALEAMR